MPVITTGFSVRNLIPFTLAFSPTHVAAATKQLTSDWGGLACCKSFTNLRRTGFNHESAAVEENLFSRTKAAQINEDRPPQRPGVYRLVKGMVEA